MRAFIRAFQVSAAVVAGVAVFATASIGFAQSIGPTVWGRVDGANYNQNIPFASGAGASAVIATTQSVTASLAGYLPLTGGALTGNLSTTGQYLSTLSNNASGSASNFVAQSAGATTPSYGWNSLGAGPDSKWWSIYTTTSGTINFNLVNDANSAATNWLSVTRSGMNPTAIASNSGAGAWTHTGAMGVTGNLTVQGTLSSTSNLQPASPTNTGVAIGGGPNYSLASFTDSTQSLDNRVAQAIFFVGSQTFRFTKDDGSAATAWLSGTGGYAKGITGITSNSGSGIWAHTGNFTATGSIGNAVAGGNNIVLTGSAFGSTPSISTSGANTNISLNINTQGGGGINLNSSTAVTGNISATGTGTMPVYGNTGTAFPAQHMVTGYVTLAASAATVTLSGAAVFTSATTYTCTANDTTAAAAVKVTPSSGTSIAFAGTTTDVLAYQCVGN